MLYCFKYNRHNSGIDWSKKQLEQKANANMSD